MSDRVKFSVTKKDLELTWFSGTGGGGQHRNKHMNCARIRHVETGIISTGQSNRERPANLKEALRGLAKHPRFKLFCEIKLREIEIGKTIEQEVEEMMKPENIRIMVKDENGQWVEETEKNHHGDNQTTNMEVNKNE